jgi:predicted TPR repeat methyltransferase
MLTDATLSQAVGFFVGNADTQAADRFRELRTDVDDRRTRVTRLLDDADGTAATEAAAAVVEAAYDHYAETLEGLGVKVKPVC